MVWRWSKTAATNATADSTINWAEGMAPSAVNDSARAEMARVAQYRDDIAGALLTTGTGTAYAVSSNQVFDTLAHLDGAMVAFTPHATNTGAVTLNVDGLGAKNIRPAPGVDLVDGSLLLGTPYVVTYSNTDSSFYLQGGLSNPYGVPVGGMIEWTGVTAPNSAFAMPYGQTLSRTTYATLWTFAQVQIAAGNTLYNNGNGTTTFGILNGRGRVGTMPDNMGGSAANVFTGLAVGTTGGVTGASQTLALPNLPNVIPSWTGTPATITVISVDGGIVNGTVEQNLGVGGGVQKGMLTNGSGSSGFRTSTGSYTPAGSNGSINGGVTQTAFSVAMPYIGINKILRII